MRLPWRKPKPVPQVWEIWDEETWNLVATASSAREAITGVDFYEAKHGPSSLYIVPPRPSE